MAKLAETSGVAGQVLYCRYRPSYPAKYASVLKLAPAEEVAACRNYVRILSYSFGEPKPTSRAASSTSTCLALTLQAISPCACCQPMLRSRPVGWLIVLWIATLTCLSK